LSSEVASLKRALQRERGATKRRGRQAKQRERAEAARERLRNRYLGTAAKLQGELDELNALAAGADLIELAPPPPGALAAPGARGRGLEAPAPAPASAAKPDYRVGKEFSQFLQSIGEAMVSAQRELDQETHRYIAAAKAGSMPAMFRLPRLNAQIRFELEGTKETGFNLILYRSDSTSKEMRQHSLDFEIVAVPPPPGYAPPLAAWSPAVGAERERILGAVLPGASTGLRLDTMADAKRVIVWTLAAPGVGRLVLLAYAPTSQPRDARLALVGPDDQTLTNTELTALTAQPEAPVSQMVAFIRELSARQEQVGA
jgi:hypothetical protein